MKKSRSRGSRNVIVTRERASIGGVVAGAAAIGYSFGFILSGEADVSPLRYGLIAVLIGVVWARVLPRVLGLKVPLLAWWFGLAAIPLVWFAPRIRLALSGLSFDRVGLLWLFGSWHKVDPGTYIILLGLGAIMAVIWFVTIFRSRNDGRLIAFVGLSSLACAGVWRSIMHPPSGDEPAILLAAWHWLGTGSLDLSNALGGPAEVWSRVIEFRDELHVYHTAGLVDGPRYTVHGILLPVVFGVLLAPAGRIGLMLALTALAGAVAWGMARTARELTGRPVSSLWLAAVLAGSPVAVYTVFMSPDLTGAGLFALGCFGLATRRVLPLAVAVVVLPWMHHKLGLTAVGLVAGALFVSPRMGVRAGIAFLASAIPEFLIINMAFGIPLWPPADWWSVVEGAFTRHPHVGTYSLMNWMRSVPGLLVDRYAGLIYYPAWVIAMLGCAVYLWPRRPPWRLALVRGQRRAAAGVFVACVPYLIVLLSYDTWMGGDGAPGRMLVIIFPALALGLAMLEAIPLTGFWRKMMVAAVWVGVAHTQVLLYVPAVAFRSAKLKVESLLAGVIGIDPLAILPGVSLSRASGFPGWLALLWMGVLATVFALMVRPRRGR